MRSPNSELPPPAAPTHLLHLAFASSFAPHVSRVNTCLQCATHATGRFRFHRARGSRHQSPSPRAHSLRCSVEPVDALCIPRLCCVDMDGTLLNSSSAIPERNVETVKRVLEETDVEFVPATGKSRFGAIASMAALGEYLQDRHPGGVPGVFLQGLVVYGRDGSLLFERALPQDVSLKIVALARRLDVSLIAYAGNGDEIVCEQKDNETDKVEMYKEPNPRALGDWKKGIETIPMRKFIFMASEERILEIRPEVEKEMAGVSEITRATPGMLEVLPLGASKGAGVLKLLEHYGVDAKDVFAIGDGENDVEMLQLCGISVAVANAGPLAAAAASFTTASNDDAGVADALERFVLKPASARPLRSAAHDE